MLVTNIEILPDRRIVEHLGLVQGSSVRAKHVGRDIMAGLKNIFGVNQSVTGGNMRVVEATGSRHARPKLLSSMYAVERIIDPGRGVPAMILEVRRHGTSGSRVAVMRV
ncbi:MAG: heavy metal-binding domain-containing protein [Candidatus Thiodiazotropha taylori]|nr:heavy metal-binding domain-containing protein [Candidatus Thiodiazotropha taylori]